MNSKNLSELVSLQESIGSAEVDETNGLVKGVVILTGNKKSKNKTFYTDKSLKEGVVRYEGAKMYLDHPKAGERNRSIRDLGGHYENVRIEGNLLKGDLHVLESVRPIIMSIAKTKMKGVGLSIKDSGHGQEKDGMFLVEGFNDVDDYSIDFVTSASVNQNLFESTKGGEDMKELTLEKLREERPDLLESYKAEVTKDLVKELQEAKEKGGNSDAVVLKANKTLALCEANFSNELRPKVLSMIESADISMESAKSIIKGQKEIVEAFQKANASGAPDLNGGKPKSLQEGKGGDADISDDDFAVAVKG